MKPAQNDVATVFTMHLVLPSAMTAEVVVELSYRASDPYAVRAQFVQEGRPASTWLVARDVLAQGLVATQDAPAGFGDVHIWRDEDPDYVLLTLHGNDGEALLAAPAEALERFMEAARTLVPFGAEGDRVAAAVDALVARLQTA